MPNHTNLVIPLRTVGEVKDLPRKRKRSG